MHLAFKFNKEREGGGWWRAIVIHSFLLTQDLGDNQRNLGSDRRFKTDKRKSYVKRMDYGPCSRKKMSWILEAKMNSKDDQIRAREAHGWNMNEECMQGGRGLQNLCGAGGTLDTSGPCSLPRAYLSNRLVTQQLPYLPWDAVSIETKKPREFDSLRTLHLFTSLARSALQLLLTGVLRSSCTLWYVQVVQWYTFSNKFE